MAFALLAIAGPAAFASTRAYTPPKSSGDYTPPKSSGDYTPPTSSGGYSAPNSSGTTAPQSGGGSSSGGSGSGGTNQAKPTVQISPATTVPGHDLHIVAGPFTPGEYVQVTDSYAKGGTVSPNPLGGAHADARGMIEFDKTISQQTVTGAHQLCASGYESSLEACAVYTVRAAAPGTSKPSGSAPGAAGGLGERITSEGTALARAFALRPTDLPAGFAPVSASDSATLGSAEALSLRCPGFSIELGDLTVNGRLVKAFVHNGGGLNVSLVATVADVFASADQAQTLLARIMRPALVGCLERGVGAALGSSVKTTLVGSTFGAVPGVRVPSGRAAVSLAIGADGKTLPLACAVAAVESGRALALVLTFALGQAQAPSAESLVQDMSRRMP